MPFPSVSLSVPIVLALPLLGIAGQQSAPAQAPRPIPDGEGKIILQRSCATCHALNVVTSKRAAPAEWNSVMQQMISRGAQGSDRDFATLTKYLAANFGPDAPQYLAPSSAPVVVQLPPDEPAAPRKPSKIHVNVNHASLRELESALGLSAEEAKTLIDYRERNGNFRNWHEVGEIPGVPAGKIIASQDRIVF